MRQAVAYTTLRRDETLLCLRRRDHHSRAELAGRWTVVFGGHLNPTERDGFNGLRRALLRELAEEFGQLRVKRPRFMGLVADPNTEVGKRHLGFVFEAALRSGTVELDRSYDNEEYGLIAGRPRFLAIEALLGLDSALFDTWSQLVLAAYRPDLA
jgi:predicted NUDIX family phosphoesterase